MPEVTKNPLIITLPSDTEILMTRVFDAPRELVFESMTKPEHIRKWWGPRGSVLKVCEMDFRVGGSWRYVMECGGHESTFTGVFHKITPPTGLVGTECYEEPMFGNPKWKTTMTLEEHDGKTKMTSHVVHPNKEARDGHYNSGMEKGAAETFDRLEDLLAGRPTQSAPLARNPMEGELEIVRIFDAPRELVYEAWTQPEHMTQWWGPTVFSNHSCKLDVRPGGAWQIVMRSPDGTNFRCEGIYSEVVKPERLVFTNDAVDHTGTLLLKGLTSVVFAAEGNKTKLTLKTRVVGQVPFAPMMIKGMEQGWNQSLDSLTTRLVTA